MLPAGRGNDFARMLGLPESPDDLAKLLLEADPRQVDLLSLSLPGAGERRVAGSVYSGVDARASEIVDRAHWLPKRLQYPYAAIRSLATYRPGRFRVTVDGTTAEYTAATVVVANSGYYGKGMNIAPDATVDDGVLDVVVIEAASRWELIRSLPKVYDGGHVALPEVTVLTGRRVEVAADSRTPVPVGGDGEPLGVLPGLGAAPAVVEVLPGALSICLTRWQPDSEAGTSGERPHQQLGRHPRGHLVRGLVGHLERVPGGQRLGERRPKQRAGDDVGMQQRRGREHQGYAGAEAGQVRAPPPGRGSATGTSEPGDGGHRPHVVARVAARRRRPQPDLDEPARPVVGRELRVLHAVTGRQHGDRARRHLRRRPGRVGVPERPGHDVRDDLESAVPMRREAAAGAEEVVVVTHHRPEPQTAPGRSRLRMRTNAGSPGRTHVRRTASNRG